MRLVIGLVDSRSGVRMGVWDCCGEGEIICGFIRRGSWPGYAVLGRERWFDV